MFVMGAFPRLEDVQERANGAVEAGETARDQASASSREVMIVAPQLEADVDVRIAPKVRPHAVERKTDGIRIRGTRSGTAKAIHPVRRFRSDTDRRPRDFDVKTGTRLRGLRPTKARIALREWSFGVRVRPQGPRLRRALRGCGA
jgi:hypothetical protein